MVVCRLLLTFAPAQQDGSAAASVCSEGEESPGNTEHRPS